MKSITGYKRITLLTVALLVTFVVTAFASPQTAKIEKPGLSILADRFVRGESMSAAEKQVAIAYIKTHRDRYPQQRTPPPHISDVDTSGGPDGLGYRWMDNREPNGPTFNWVDIQSSGTNAGISGDDETSAMLPIGFTFPFYGQNFTQFTVSVDGFISFSSSAANLQGAAPYSGWFFQNYPMPTVPIGSIQNTATTAPFMICPFWDDLYLTPQNNVKYQNVGGNLVVQWISNTFFENVGNLAFEMILSPTGTIKFQYDTLNTGDSSLNSCTIGIMDSAGTNGLQICYNTNPNNLITAGRAFLIYRLGAPSNPTPSNNATGVPTNTDLSWTAGPAAAAYNVFFGTANPPVTQVITRQNVLTYTPTLAASTSYYWQVVSLNDTSASASTAAGPVWHFTTGTGVAPLAPSNGAISTVTLPTTSSITLTWNDNSSDETGFPIYKMGETDTSFTLAATAAANATSYTVTGLNPGTHYNFRVYASNAGATSLNFATAAGWTVPVSAGAPAVNLSGGGYTSIAVTSVPADANGPTCTYKIHEINTNQWISSTNSLSAVDIRSVIRSGWAGYVVNNLNSGTTYTFQVIAVNGNNVAAAAGPSTSITTNDNNHGGPDGFGYRYISSAATGGPVFNWVDITTTGTNSGIVGDDVPGQIPMGTFSFPFYGTTVNQAIGLYASTDGQLTVGTGSGSYVNGNLPTASLPALSMAVCWCDMYVTTPEAIYYQNMNDGRFIVELVMHNLDLNYTVTCEAIIYADGRILYQYNSFSTPSAMTYLPTVGIQGATSGANSLAYIQNIFGTAGTQYPTANTAVLFYTLGQASNPVPPDVATNVATNSLLQWSAAPAAVAYNVKFGTVNPPPSVSQHQTGLTYSPTLAASTQYYWQVIALSDTAGSTTNAGPVWSFTTGAGASPAAPTNAIIDSVADATTTSLHLHWTSNSSGTESRFVIFRSTDGIAFSRFDSVATGIVQYTNTGLSVNTHYWYRVYAFGNGVMSTQYAGVNAYTLANVPGVTTCTIAGITTAMLTFGATVQNGNPTSTQYAIYLSNLGQYIQANGNPDTAIFWQTAAAWGDPTTVRGLISQTSYHAQVKARNGAHVPTAFGIADTFATGTGLVGTRTVGGTNPDFNTLHDAVNAITSVGVGTPGVTFLIRGGTYSEPPDSFGISMNLGANNTVTFRPADTTAVIINKQCTSTNSSALLLTNVTNVTFDGSPSSAPGRRVMTINAATTSGYSVIRFNGGVTNCAFKNMILTQEATPTSSYPVYIYNGNTDPNTTDTIYNCSMTNGYYDMYLYSASGTNSNLYIAKNQLTNFYYYGMYIYNCSSTTFRNNEIYRTAATTNFQYAVYSGSSLNTNNVFDGNWIHDINTTSQVIAMYLYNGPNQLIMNNMIDVEGTNIGYTYGIYLGSDRSNLFNNTINIAGTGATSTSSIGIYFGLANQDSVANNVIVNTRTGGTAPTYYNVCIYGPTTATMPYVYSDYNLLTTVDENTTDNIYAVRFGSVNYNTLTDLRLAAGYTGDVHSTSVPPTFVLPPDLHINPNIGTPVESAGTPLASVTHDFDNDPRNAVTPDIGADEGAFRLMAFGTLSGIVKDSSSVMAPLAGVAIRSGRYMDTTDADGHFSMNVLVGTYSVIFSVDCFKTDSTTMTVDSAQTDSITYWMYHPEISTDHTSIDILSQPGEMHSTTLTLTNPGNSDLHWTGVAVSNSHAFDKWSGHSNANNGIHLSVVDGANAVSHNGTVKIPLKGSMDATSGTMMVKAVVTPGKSKQSNMTDAAPGSVTLKGTTASGNVNPRTNSIDELDTITVFSEDFSGTTFPPTGWTIQNPDNGLTWQQQTGTPSWAYIDFWGYTTRGQLDYLITPTIDLSAIPSAVAQFNWSYASGFVGTYDDGLELSYSTDNGSTWNRLWYATANDSLIAGTGATTTGPATSNFGFAQVILPAAALGQADVKFALIGHNDYGPNIYVTNFVVASTTPPFLSMSPTSGDVAPHQASELFIQATIDSNATIPATWTGVINLTSDACPHLVAIPVTVTIDSVVSVKQVAAIPYEYKLYQNYPNPFNPSTEVRFDLKQAGMTHLTIYDVIGRQVAELVNRQLPAGFHSIHFDGSRLATGVYFYRIQSGRFTDTKKMILVK